MANDNIEAAVDAWCTDEAAATATYGDIKTWNTDGVTSMKGLMSPEFQNGDWCGDTCRPHMSTCNPEIGGWNTGAVTDMRQVEGALLSSSKAPPPLALLLYFRQRRRHGPIDERP